MEEVEEITACRVVVTLLQVALNAVLMQVGATDNASGIRALAGKKQEAADSN